MSNTVNIDLPYEYWKELRAIGVFREQDNEKCIVVSFSRGLSDAELRRFHDFVVNFENRKGEP